jgi:hypothetical protein
MKNNVSPENHARIQKMRDEDKHPVTIKKAISEIDPNYKWDKSIYGWLKKNKP